MSLYLPLSDSPLREMFEVSALVEPMKLPNFRDALQSCREAVKQRNVRSAQALAIRADGNVWLIQVGKRGAWKKLWCFGIPFGF